MQIHYTAQVAHVDIVLSEPLLCLSKHGEKGLALVRKSRKNNYKCVNVE